MVIKYILKVEDKLFELMSEEFFRVKEFNSLVFDWNGLNMLTPYIEPDLEQVKADAYLEGLKDGQAVTLANEQNNAFNDGYKKCLKDMEQVRKDAYEDGYENGFVAGHLKAEKSGQKFYEDGYKRGLSDAWEAARKIVFDDINFIGTAFGSGTRSGIIRDLTASEVIEVLKVYEQDKEEIKVGNEVKAFEKKPFIVTGFGYGDDEEDVYCHGFVTENGISISAKKNSCVKTCRHFPEIAAIFEKMRNESNEQIDT